MLQMAQVFVSKSGSNIGCHVAQIFIDIHIDDYVGDKIPLWEKIMDRQGTVCCTWEKTAFEEGLKVGIRLMMEVYSL